MLRQFAGGARNGVRREAREEAGIGYRFRLEVEQIDALDAAHAAAAAPGQRAALFLQLDERLLHDREMDFGVR